MWQQKQKQANKKFSTFDHFATTRNLMMSDIHAKTCTQSSSWVSSFSLWVISGRVEWTTNYHYHRYIIMLIIFIIIKSTLSICWSHCLVKGRLIFFLIGHTLKVYYLAGFVPLLFNEYLINRSIFIIIIII